MPSTAVPFVAAIIERTHHGRKQLLIQTRMKPLSPPIYNGTFEFVAGTLDALYENVYDCLAREITEETGLHLTAIIDDSRTDTHSPQQVDAAFGFRPFCCVQQLREGRPWVGFIFRCTVSDEEPVAQLGETQDVHWVDRSEVYAMFTNAPAKLFTLELPAWDYYFKETTDE